MYTFNGFQTLTKKLMICGPKNYHQNLSFKFEVNLLESKLGLRSKMAKIYAIFPLDLSLDSRFEQIYFLTY